MQFCEIDLVVSGILRKTDIYLWKTKSAKKNTEKKNTMENKRRLYMLVQKTQNPSKFCPNFDKKCVCGIKTWTQKIQVSSKL